MVSDHDRGGRYCRWCGYKRETPVVLQDMEPKFDWGVAYGSYVYADPIHHIIEGGRMLCSGGKAHTTHYGTSNAPRPCARCRRVWRKQTDAD